MTSSVKALGEIVGLTDPIHVLDVGASIIPSSEVPLYRSLLDLGLATLSAFDGDLRQIAEIEAMYGTAASVFPQFLFDGSIHDLYVMTPASGLTSLLEPHPLALAFFNGFSEWANVIAIETVQTTRLDDVGNLPKIDFAKMDVQGSELTILQNGAATLADCVAIQLEISFFHLYKKQPSFGEIDLWMRSQGYTPHRFAHIKRWSIAPIVFDNDVRSPGNQLLEADIIYIRDPLTVDTLTLVQLKKLILLSHYCFGSPDLCGKLILELMRRKEADQTALIQYTQLFNMERAAAR